MHFSPQSAGVLCDIKNEVNTDDGRVDNEEDDDDDDNEEVTLVARNHLVPHLVPHHDDVPPVAYVSHEIAEASASNWCNVCESYPKL